MRIGIFGGTFDPFTKAHMAIVKAAIDKNLVDEVHIVPTVVAYHRQGKERWLDNYTRKYIIDTVVKYLTASTKYADRIFICTTEYDFAKNHAPYIVGKRRYIDTLNQFIWETENAYSNVSFEYYTIIGTDSYKNFKTWTNWEDILKLSKLIVVNGRDEEDVQLDIPKIDLSIDSSLLTMSSTKIREQFKDKVVEDYIFALLDNDYQEQVYYKTPIFDLVKKIVPKLDFNPVGINSKDWVSIVVEWNNKFLLVKQLRYGLMRDQIEFPCGMVEHGEEPLVAAKRELKEETGIELLNDSQIKCLGKYAANPAFMNNFMHYFYVNLDYAKFLQGDTDFDEHEKIEELWMDKEEFMDKVRSCDPSCASVFMALVVNMIENRNIK